MKSGSEKDEKKFFDGTCQSHKQATTLLIMDMNENIWANGQTSSFFFFFFFFCQVFQRETTFFVSFLKEGQL